MLLLNRNMLMKKEVDKGTRAINYIVDLAIIYILTIVIQLIFQTQINPNVIAGILYFLYYLLFESIFGQTIGKKITGTCVLDLNNKKPNFIKIFFRTILRYNPFDGISYLFGQVQGTHDVLSRTRLRRAEEVYTKRSVK